MTVEAIKGRVASCAYFIEGVLYRREFLVDFLISADAVLA